MRLMHLSVKLAVKHRKLRSMISKSEKGYQLVADEYYDAKLHPTCANFREASKIFLSRWINELPNEGWLAEVGPGMSLMAELILTIKKRQISKIILVDSSRTMLKYSLPWSITGATPLLGDAESLPIASKSLHGIVSSLGDPYNSQAFWREAARVLIPGSVVLFTTPSFEWSNEFRASNNEQEQNSAKFVLRDGSVVNVPSYIFDTQHQVAMMVKNGFCVEQREEITVSDIKNPSISPKLRLERGGDSSIVTGYLARKTE